MDNDELYSRIMQESLMQRNGCGQPMLAMIIIAIILIFSSCATKTKVEYVDREVVKYETKIQHDTLINNIHDSVYHTVFQKGDTIYDTKYVEKTKYRDRVVVRIDTCYRDSMQTVIKESVKEKQIIPKWCYYLLVFSIIVIIFAIIKVIRWLQIH